jgi:hypothetical protein
MNPRLLAAPARSGECLIVPDFDRFAAAIQNQQHRLDSECVSDLRHQARRDLGIADTAPIIITGHQPELFHPGVWVKNFAAAGLAHRLGGHAVNLIADTDTIRSAAITLPTLDIDQPDSTVAIDDSDVEQPYESRLIRNSHVLASVGERIASETNSWLFRPLAVDLDWAAVVESAATIADVFTQLRTTKEHEWGLANREITVRTMSRWPSFQMFIEMIDRDTARFRDVYNHAIQDYRRINKLRSRNHPAPLLDEGERPFWAITGQRRERAYARHAHATLRPRALTLTLFARLVLGDAFIHGLGGGKYDTVTDQIIRDFFKIDPPRYQILTATLHLPWGHQDSRDDTARHKLSSRDYLQMIRDQHWNPQRHVQDTPLQNEHHLIVAMPQQTSQERRVRYAAFREFLDRARLRFVDSIGSLQAAAMNAQRQEHWRSILNRRDFSWVLYPESQLKPFMTQMARIASGGGSQSATI